MKILWKIFIIAQSLILLGGGGRILTPNYDYQYKNLEKEDNEQFSLINLASKSHCLIESPSQKKINNLNLQLHAGRVVSNPYTFNITSNTKFEVDSIKTEYYTLTIGTDYNNLHGYLVDNFGDISPKEYQSCTITGLYFEVVQNTLYFVSTMGGKFTKEPELIIIDDSIEQNERVIFKYYRSGVYKYEFQSSDLPQYFMYDDSNPTRSIKFYLKGELV